MHERDLTAALERDYGIVATAIVRHAGGFEADAFVVDERWFVKAWRRGAPAHLAVLEQLKQRGLPVAPPVRTTDGRLTTPEFAVYPFVAGRRADDAAVLGRTLRMVHAVTDIELPRTSMDEWCIDFLRDQRNHPWIVDRRDELATAIDRLEAAIARARCTDVPYVLVHNDLYGDNLLVGDDGEPTAILDWDHACLAPREHDLWTLIDEPDPGPLLDAYGGTELNRSHLEYAFLARALRDLAARVQGEVDRAGIEEWGFCRLARVDRVLDDLCG